MLCFAGRIRLPRLSETSTSMSLISCSSETPPPLNREKNKEKRGSGSGGVKLSKPSAWCTCCRYSESSKNRTTTTTAAPPSSSRSCMCWGLVTEAWWRSEWRSSIPLSWAKWCFPVPGSACHPQTMMSSSPGTTSPTSRSCCCRLLFSKCASELPLPFTNKIGSRTSFFAILWKWVQWMDPAACHPFQQNPIPLPPPPISLPLLDKFLPSFWSLHNTYRERETINQQSFATRIRVQFLLVSHSNNCICVADDGDEGVVWREPSRAETTAGWYGHWDTRSIPSSTIDTGKSFSSHHPRASKLSSSTLPSAPWPLFFFFLV